MSENSHDDDLVADLIWGVRGPDGLAAYLGKRPSEVYYLLSKNALPHKRLGGERGTIVSSKRELREYFRINRDTAA